MTEQTLPTVRIALAYSDLGGRITVPVEAFFEFNFDLDRALINLLVDHAEWRTPAPARSRQPSARLADELIDLFAADLAAEDAELDAGRETENDSLPSPRKHHPR